jgi:hypothetical protein
VVVAVTDARFPERWLLDRRIDRLSDRDFRSFVNSLAWSVSNRTDGLIEERDFALIPRFTPGSVGALVASELWEVVTRHNEIAWRIADFKKTQSGRDELEVLENVRAAEREKKRRQRARKAAANTAVPVDIPVDCPLGHVPRDDTGKARTGQAQTEPPLATPKSPKVTRLPRRPDVIARLGD